jgi:DNA-directed RNA polymerase specialized sigma24 family protein
MNVPILPVEEVLSPAIPPRELADLLLWILIHIRKRWQRNGRQRSDAEDLASCGTAHLLLRIREFEEGRRDPKKGWTGKNGASLRTWAYSVAYRKTLDEIRKSNKSELRHVPIERALDIPEKTEHPLRQIPRIRKAPDHIAAQSASCRHKVRRVQSTSTSHNSRLAKAA